MKSSKWLALVFAVIFATPIYAQERIEIDGAKHPEQIPEYRAWTHVYHILADRPHERFPTVLLSVLTPEESRRVARESARAVAGQQQCWDRLAEARAPLAKLERDTGQNFLNAGDTDAWTVLARKIDPIMWEIELGCRWDILHARDDLLAALKPESAGALMQFAEEVKRGITVSVPKNAIDRFRQPQ